MVIAIKQNSFFKYSKNYQTITLFDQANFVKPYLSLKEAMALQATALPTGSQLELLHHAAPVGMLPM